MPQAFADWRCEVVALEVERSFREKVTILHAEYHRPADKPTPDRFSRHYADTAAPARHPTAGEAAGRSDLCEPPGFDAVLGTPADLEGASIGRPTDRVIPLRS